MKGVFCTVPFKGPRNKSSAFVTLLHSLGSLVRKATFFINEHWIIRTDDDKLYKGIRMILSQDEIYRKNSIEKRKKLYIINKKILIK